MKPVWIAFILGGLFGFLCGWYFLGLLIISRDIRNAQSIIDEFLRKIGDEKCPTK